MCGLEPMLLITQPTRPLIPAMTLHLITATTTIQLMELH